MLQILLFIGIFFLLIFLFVLIFILRFVFGGVKAFRRFTRSFGEGSNGSETEGGGFFGGGGGSNPFDNWRYTYRRRQQPEGDTIIDNRDPNEANRKIFGKNDGEYVDFEEVK